jgi:autotransporter-associated beta strand protein
MLCLKKAGLNFSRRILFFGFPGLCAAIFSLLPNYLLANNPGGFSSLVTTAVTTGTETYNGHADRYLDNGILHVLIENNGSVESIHYLKPGSSGTPEANGTEMVSQSGVNFGNHTAIYYYWYPDGNGDATYLNTVVGSTNVDVAYLRTYNPAADSVVADVELHYELGKGNTGIYCYIIVRHPASYAVYTNNLNISFMQCIWPTAHDNTNFLCENQYLDNSTKYGLFLGGVQQKRNGLQPNFYDCWHTIGVTNMPKEILQYTTGLFAGSTNSKYSFTLDYPKIDTFGMASDTNQIGLWYVAGGHEYQNNGPTACEYAGGIGGLLLYEPIIAHYNNTGLTVSSNANWTKIYGPWLLYFNSQSNGAACWADSQQQALAEKSVWPYAWLTNSVYQSKNQRASISGKLVISDPLRPQANAAGAWIGMAAPDAGLENDPANWQYQSDGYQFWTQCAADGSFILPPVTTFSPYGGSQTYTLYAYCAGTNGSVGEFQTGPFTFAPGAVTNLGTLTWKVPHPGSRVLWEIGYPDRTAAKYRHGDEYGRPSMWINFGNEFSSPLEYFIASNNWATALNYAHTVDYTTNTPWKWHLNFNLPSVKAGTYWLNISYATADSYQIVRVNNDNSYVADFVPDNGTPGTTTMIREGIHSKYTVAHVPIPSASLVVGANVITLDHEYHSDHANDNFMYDYLNLEAPLPQLTWRGDGTSNNWDIGVSTNWFDGGSLVTYGDLSPVIFDDTGSASPAVNLIAAAQPASVNVTANKDYSINGNALYGTMTLAKTGNGTLALNNTNSYSGNTTVSNGTLLVNGIITSPVTVFGGTLGGGGTVAGNVALQSGATLSPGKAGAPCTFSIANTLVVTNYTDTNDDIVTGTYFITNNLALTNNNLYFHLATGSNDLVQLNGGTLTLAGTSTVYPTLTAGLPAAGNYPLITGGSATIGGAANLAWGGIAGTTRQTYTLDTSQPGTVLLHITNAAGVLPLTNSLVWRGTNGNNWDVTTTTNWINGTSADEFYNYDAVTFNDTSTNGSVAVSGTVQPAWLLVTNTTRTYTISGGPIGGTATLIKSGTGMLQMAGASHSYTGGTVINAGTLQVNDLAGLGGGQITLNGGLLKSAYGTANTFGLTNDIIVPAGATAGINSANRFAPGGRLFGGGVLNFTNASTQNRCDLKGNWSSFAGTINIIGPNGNNGIRLFNQGGSFTGFDDANVYLDGVVSDPQLFSSGLVINIGALSGTATAVLRGASLGGTTGSFTTYSIGALDLNTTFAGSFQDSTGKAVLIKAGTGTLTLTGNNTYSGPTTISAGTLQIGGGGTSGTIGTNMISDSGTLAFNRSDSVNDASMSLVTGGGGFAQNGPDIFTFTKAQPYTGPTFINSGTLALSGSGAIASSANIILAGGTLFDVSGTSGGGMTLASGQTLSGIGSVRGNFTVGSGATLLPGNPLGTLNFSNNLALASGATVLLAVSHSPLTNDSVNVIGALTNGGNLIVTNSGSTALTAGDSFQLFNCGNYSGSFANVTLPVLTSGLAWNTNSLNSAGRISVISIVPQIGAVAVAGTNLVLQGGGGMPFGNYYVLASTNLALPLASWSHIVTNAYDAAGNFIFTNAISPVAPQQFYLIRSQ